MTLNEETERMTAMLRGKIVKSVARHREHEVMVVFEDGSRFFADSDSPLELSITPPDDASE